MPSSEKKPKQPELGFVIRNRPDGHDLRASTARVLAAVQATKDVPMEALQRGDMVAPTNDSCTFHIFTCAACSRQWTVHMTKADETTQCYFVGLCFDCLNGRGIGMWRAAELLAAALPEVTA